MSAQQHPAAVAGALRGSEVQEYSSLGLDGSMCLGAAFLNRKIHDKGSLQCFFCPVPSMRDLVRLGCPSQHEHWALNLLRPPCGSPPVPAEWHVRAGRGNSLAAPPQSGARRFAALPARARTHAEREGPRRASKRRLVEPQGSCTGQVRPGRSNLPDRRPRRHAPAASKKAGGGQFSQRPTPRAGAQSRPAGVPCGRCPPANAPREVAALRLGATLKQIERQVR